MASPERRRNHHATSRSGPGSLPRRRSPVARAASIRWIGLASAAASGCASTNVPADPPRQSGPATRTVRADWNDLSAAISRASAPQAVAPLGSGSTTQPSAQFELLSIDGQTVTVRFEAQEPWSAASGPVPIVVTAMFGEPSDDERAAALVAQIAGSLEALAGREFRPLKSE